MELRFSVGEGVEERDGWIGLNWIGWMDGKGKWDLQTKGYGRASRERVRLRH